MWIKESSIYRYRIQLMSRRISTTYASIRLSDRSLYNNSWVDSVFWVMVF